MSALVERARSSASTNEYNDASESLPISRGAPKTAPNLGGSGRQRLPPLPQPAPQHPGSSGAPGRQAGTAPQPSTGDHRSRSRSSGRGQRSAGPGSGSDPTPDSHPASLGQPSSLLAGMEVAGHGGLLHPQGARESGGTCSPVATRTSHALAPDTDTDTAQFQASHHAFIPKHRAPSSYVRKHAATHTLPGLLLGARGRRPSPSSLLKAAGLDQGQGGGQVGQLWGAAEQGGGWGATSSVGDLEALDSILDQLVVLDPRMREALLQGPLVSFETVVPEERASRSRGTGSQAAAGHTADHTFLTSVKGLEGEEGQAQQLEQELGPLAEQEVEIHPPQEHLQQQEGEGEARGAGNAAVGGPGGRTQAPLHATAYGDLEGLMPEVLHASIPVPILPKLARMYITSKQSCAVKAPPAPPPTAEWLLRARPAQVAASAPSYDDLCGQIRDVQRQYTCGTARERTSQAASRAELSLLPRTTLDQYISGLDGPSLDEVVAPPGMEMQGMDRAKPSFVSMKRAGNASARRAGRSRSPPRRRNYGPDLETLPDRPCEVQGEGAGNVSD